MNKKDLLLAFCKKNGYDFSEVSHLDMTSGDYFQLIFPTPDENKINSMNEVNYLIDYLENLILDAEKEYQKRFDSNVLMIVDSNLVFCGWKKLERTH
jgi:hypothetical protein